MDFVDLDKVLDEFEEEEKQALSIVPGQELKPSGYLEFLKKHQEQEWASLNPSKFSSSSGYTLERRSAREPVDIPYDDPYESFSGSKPGFISDSDSLSQNGFDRVSDVKKRSNQSAIVTNLTRVSMNGEDVNTVYTSTNTPGRKGIANSSERKGTIAYQPIEVQTDALSPASEQELMSSPFPKSDILVDGHGDTTVSNEPKSINETDQNHSPIYASMDTANIIMNNGMGGQQSFPPFNSCANENQTKGAESRMSQRSEVQVTDISQHLPAGNVSENRSRFLMPEQAVGFHDPVDEDLNDDEVNMYLNELDEGSIDDISSSRTSQMHPSGAGSHQIGMSVPDIQSGLNHVKDSKTRSLADELDEADAEIDHYSMSHSESVPKKFRSDVTNVGGDGTSHPVDPDIVQDLGHHQQPETLSAHSGEFSANNSDINKDNASSVVFDTLKGGKMEIGCLLDEKKDVSVAESIGENLLGGKPEIEGILDEVIQNQKYSINHDLHPDQLSGKLKFSNSSHNQPDVTHSSESARNYTEGMLKEGPTVAQDSDSTSPFNSISSINSETGSPILHMGVGARPKDPSAIKKNRPNSLLGLSKVNLDLPSVVRTTDNMPDTDTTNPNAQNLSTCPDVAVLAQESSSRQDVQTISEARQRMHSAKAGEQENKPVIHDFTQSINQNPVEVRQDQTFGQDDSSQNNSQAPRTKRPTSLNLPARPEFNMGEPTEEDMEQEDTSESPTVSEELTAGVRDIQAASGAAPVVAAADDRDITVGSQSSPAQSSIGYEAPYWTPDSEAQECMKCESKFTMWKRRHHCRACGKIFCSVCCSQKALLPYLEHKEARVCIDCHVQLSLAPGAGNSPRCPNPNNPNEYCSKVPPNQQASNHAIPPVVMVPTGVLKTSGSQRRTGEPKQVMFSDGIRPGGDLTELDGPEQARAPRRSARAARRAGQQQQTSPSARKNKEDSLLRSPSLVPEEGLPPLFISQGDCGYVERDETLNQLDYTADYKSEEGPVISYAVNKNLSVGVKIINLDCCVNRVCWCFTTRGMDTAGQCEFVILLELTEEELTDSSLQPPRDIFQHFHMIYEEALKGNIIEDMGHSIFHQNFLGNRELGGFLFLRPTFQCLNKLHLPQAPYLFGILLQKWEVPWAKVFPIRLMLRLGAEYRYYPCPLVSVRNRKPVFFEIGHTIINLLADFRNYQYMLSQIRGATIHMESKKTIISFPRNRYNDVMKVVRNSNEHVMALGSSFSSDADSHLVCIQNEDGNYQTQAINIQNKPRLVTGASFVVFNGALKSSSGLRAKSSIVEDGLMVQVLPEAMVSIKEALKDMIDHVILCGPADASTPEEMVELRWVDNDRNFNVGIKSYIDDTPLEGVENVSVKLPSDFLGETLAIRWTRVYFLQHEDSTNSHFDPMDLSRLTEDIAQACCAALIKHLDELKKGGQVKLGLRVNLTRDAVGYEIGSKGQSLPAAMISNLDTFLVPIVHQASEEGIIMELVFNIVE